MRTSNLSLLRQQGSYRRGIYLADTGDMRNAYIILESKFLKMRSFERYRRRWEDNIKINHRKRRDGSDSIKLA